MPITEHEPGGFMDRCGRCGGWISMGHAAGSACREELLEGTLREARRFIEKDPTSLSELAMLGRIQEARVSK